MKRVALTTRDDFELWLFYMSKAIEIFCLGGYWDIELQDSKNAFFGLPILVGFSGYSIPICPHATAITIAARRQGTYLSTILTNIKKRQSTSI